MKNRAVTLVILANLAALLLLTIFMPLQMIAPGKLIDAHADLGGDCFACHTPLFGSAPDKCIGCHEVVEIGLKTTKGLDISREKKNVAFHQKLIEEDCVACHSDHKGVQAFRPIGRFSHRLLEAEVGEECHGCHFKPGDALHKKIEGSCVQCHNQERWTPAPFDHERYFGLLTTGEPKACEGCHRSPQDALHRGIQGDCAACHNQERWIPATFDHDRYFRFDRAHTTECETCHVSGDYSSYTCYGCHEHSRSKIRREHVEEGIYEYENCVACHRSGDEHEAEYLWQSRMRKSDRGSVLPYRRESDDDEHHRDRRDD